jgi:hypothetical protein
MKKLIGNNEIEDALKRLDRLTQEEALMASAQLLIAKSGKLQSMCLSSTIEWLASMAGWPAWMNVWPASTIA